VGGDGICGADGAPTEVGGAAIAGGGAAEDTGKGGAAAGVAGGGIAPSAGTGATGFGLAAWGEGRGAGTLSLGDPAVGAVGAPGTLSFRLGLG